MTLVTLNQLAGIKRQKSKKGTDRPTDRPTDGPTWRGVESRSTRLKSGVEDKVSQSQIKIDNEKEDEDEDDWQLKKSDEKKYITAKLPYASQCFFLSVLHPNALRDTMGRVGRYHGKGGLDTRSRGTVWAGAVLGLVIGPRY